MPTFTKQISVFNCEHCDYQATAKSRKTVYLYQRLHLKKCKFKDVDKKDKPETAQLSNAERMERIKQHAKSVGINQHKTGQTYNRDVEVDMETATKNHILTRMVKT